jgi:hypothetical protein
VPAAERYRRARLEQRFARKDWRASFGAWSVRAVWDEDRERDRLKRREATRAVWDELRATHTLELARFDADALAACSNCGARIGEPCNPANRTRFCDYRITLAERHHSDREALRREHTPLRIGYLAPSSSAEHRASGRRRREHMAERIEKARAELRAAVLRGPDRIWRATSGAVAPSPARAREQLVARIEKARADYGKALEAYRLELLAGVRVSERDSSARRPNGAVARELWRQSLERARAKYRPETVFDSDRFRSRRERTRRACSIYGTAHTASELAHVNGATYARGTVRHVPDLDRNRGGVPDHRPITLTADHWYLCVRNTVPRARRAG